MKTHHASAYQRYKGKLAAIQQKHLDKLSEFASDRSLDPAPRTLATCSPLGPGHSEVNLVLHFDGGCGPKNPGGQMTYGFHIDTEDGERLAEGAGTIPGYPEHERTNNTAEFTAVLMGLEWLTAVAFLRIGTLTVKGDSRLAVEAVAGRMKVKKTHLVTLRDDCQAAVRRIKAGRIVFQWVGREHNATADFIASGAR